MRNPLRSLLNRWKVRTSALLHWRDAAAARAAEEPFKPRLTLLENKSMPSTSVAGVVYQNFGGGGLGVTQPTLTVTRLDPAETGSGVYQAIGASSGPILIPAATDVQITSRVFRDDNGDGLQNVAEPGVSGVRVQLIDSTGGVVGTATSDVYGNFRFSTAGGSATPSSVNRVSLTPGASYRLRVTNAPAVLQLVSPRVNTLDKAGLSPATTFGGAAPEGTSGSISGLVWTDTNGNGRFDAGEPGVGNVTIFLLNDSLQVIDARVTASDGTYSFLGLPAGTYSIRFDSLSLPIGDVFTTPNAPGSDETNDSDADPATGQTAPIALAMGQMVANVDAGVFAPVIIGDFVWADLNGNGIQDNNEGGQAGVVVNLLDAAGNIVATQTTDSSGVYLFSAAPGTYQVEFLAPPGTMFSPRNAPGSTTANDSDADTVTGRTGLLAFASGDVNVDLDCGIRTQMLGTGVIGNFVFFDANQNGIQDPDEIGLPNVNITLLDALGNPLASTTPDGFGFYQFTGLAAGQYIVEFVPNVNFFALTQQGKGGNPALDSDPDPVTGRTGVITLADGEVNNTIDAGLVKPFSGLIGDFVWNDINCDGIQQPNEPGIAGVTVTLFDGKGQLYAQATTDAAGQYIFANLPPDNYTVQVTAPAGLIFSPQGKGGAPGLDSDVDPATGKSAVIAIAAGEGRTDIDVGLCTPVLTAKLGDFVWSDLNGNGIQDPNEPGIANVTVNLLDGNGGQVGTTTTDGAGKYLFANLNPGTYIVEFIAPPGTSFSPANQGNDDAVDSDADPLTGRTGPIVLVAGDDNPSVDAGIVTGPPALATVGDLVFFDANGNGIQDPQDFGIGNVVVNLLDGSGAFIATTTTDVAGNYLFTQLTPGQYIIEVIVPAGFGVSPQNQGGDDRIDSDIDPVTGRTSVITLAAGEVNLDVDAGLTKSLTVVLGDFVWNDLNCDGIQQPNEPGVANVTVNVYDGMGALVATTTTNAAGKYQVLNLAPGSYQVEFILPAGFVFTPANQGGDPAVDSNANIVTGRTQVVTLQAGESDLTLDAGLCAVAALGDFVWNDLNKNGIQDNGEPGVANVTVTLLDGMGMVIATQQTDANGKYLFSNLRPATYSVQFALPTGFVFTAQNAGGDDQIDSDANPLTGIAGPVTLAPGETNLTVDAGIFVGDVGGTLLLGDFVWLDTNGNGVQDPGEPGVANVTVTLFDGAGNVLATTTTDASGFYLFEDLDAGTYEVGFVAPAGLAFTIPNAGGDDQIDSDANPATGRTGTFSLTSNDLTRDAGLVFLKAISGFVYVDLNDNGIFEPTEAPIPGTRVTLTGTNDLGQAVFQTTVTDGNGFYQFTMLRPGVYTLTETQPKAYLDGRDTLGTPFPGVVGNDVISDIQIDAGSTNIFGVQYNFGELLPSSIQGKTYGDFNRNGIPDPGEPGIAGAKITLTGVDDRGATITRIVFTGPDGSYVFTGLRPGVYKVTQTQPPNWLDGLDRAGSQGGIVTNDMVSDIPIPIGVVAVNYDFGENLSGTGGGKEDLLASSTSRTPTLNGQAVAMLADPTYGNAVSVTQLASVGVPRFVVTSADAGSPPVVRVFDFATGANLYTITAYSNFNGGVRTAVGDVTGDGVPDIITAPGFGGGPHIRVFDGSTGALVGEFFAYAASFTGGVYVAVGDTNGDGVGEIITGAGETGGPHVRVFNLAGQVLNEFFAYAASFTGGVRVASGDVNGDGFADIITGAGPGGGPHVRVFSGVPGGGILKEFFAYDAAFRGGVFVAAGDVNGDMIADIVTGGGGNAQVRAFNGTNLALLYAAFAYGSSFTGGTRVGVVDVNGDCRADILTTPGAGLASFTRVIDVNANADLDNFLAFNPANLGGAFVSGGAG